MKVILLLQNNEDGTQSHFIYKSNIALINDIDNDLNITPQWLKKLRNQQGETITYKNFVIEYTEAKGVSDLKKEVFL